MAERNPQDQEKYVVRFPDGMRDQLKQAAAANKRSLNAEIIARLEVSFGIVGLGEANRPRRDTDVSALRREIQDLIKRLDSIRTKKP